MREGLLRLITVTMLLLIGGFAGTATAYIGPGAGLSLVGSLFGWIVGVFLTLFAIVLWPLRYLFRRLFRRKRAAPDVHSPTLEQTGTPPGSNSD